MATLLKVLNNLADIKSAGVLHFASELRQAFLLLNMPAFAGHTPGRAEFPHPVLHERDSLAAAYPWAILAGGSGWRFRSSLRRAQRTTLWRSRRDNHFCHIRTT